MSWPSARRLFAGMLVAGAVLLVAVSQALGAVGFTPGPGSPLSSGSELATVRVIDMNRDGRPDIVAANQTNPGGVSVLLGNGAGGFAPAPGSPFSAGANDSYALDVGDVNGDGVPDVVTANYTPGSVSVLLNNGSGVLTAAPGSPVGSGSTQTSEVALADVNGDRKLDVVAANQTVPGSVSVLLGNGTGGFSAASGSPVPTGADRSGNLAAGDFNRDGKLDLAVGNQVTPGSISILLGNGSGGFASAGSPVASGGNIPTSVAAGDVNGDGILDILAVNNNSSNLSSLLGNGSAGFSPAPGSPFGVGANNPVRIGTGDLDGDGHLDAVSSNQTKPGTMSALLGNGAGAFATTGSSFATGSPSTAQGVALGDVNGDAQPDAVTANQGTSSSLSVLLNTNRPGVRFVPSALDFGDVRRRRTSAARTVDFTNAGPGFFHIVRATLGGANAGDFAVTGNTCAAALVGAVCRVSVTATPKRRGGRTATLTVEDNATGSPRTVTLSVNTHPPRVFGVRAVPSVFSPVGGSSAARRRHRRGTSFRYRLSERASVRLTIQRPVRGRRRGRRCRPARRRSRGRRCTLYRRVTTLKRKGRKGANSVRFSGRVRRRALRGRFRLLVSATDAAGNRSRRSGRARFRVVRR